MSESRVTFRVEPRNRDYWNVGPGSRTITWISTEADTAPTDADAVHERVEALRRGQDQWGHDGAHHGRQGDPECPAYLHHHHDYRCALPTRDECAAAGVQYRERWASRG